MFFEDHSWAERMFRLSVSRIIAATCLKGSLPASKRLTVGCIRATKASILKQSFSVIKHEFHSSFKNKNKYYSLQSMGDTYFYHLARAPYMWNHEDRKLYCVSSERDRTTCIFRTGCFQTVSVNYRVSRTSAIRRAYCGCVDSGRQHKDFQRVHV